MNQSLAPEQLLIAGVDEVGRGPLAGPVVAAAVIFDSTKDLILGLKDSKKLSPKKREFFSEIIKREALCYAFGRAEPEEIDQINILQASLLAMQRAILNLSIEPKEILVDGNQCPKIHLPVRAIIRGDQTEPVISAASIIAKVLRDQEMCEMDLKYPGYGFAAHKGYPTKQHYEALSRLGPTILHRRSFLGGGQT